MKSSIGKIAIFLVLAVASSFVAGEIVDLWSRIVASFIAPSPTRGRLDLFAGSIGVNLYIPRGLAFDNQENLYVADSQHGSIRKISKSGESRTFNVGGFPIGLVVDGAGQLVVSDRGNRILRIDAGGRATVLAGSGQPGHSDGVGTSATFNDLQGIAMEANGSFIVADAGNNLIRRVTAKGIVTTVAGATDGGFADGPSNAAKFQYPQGVTITPAGTIVVTDTGNNRLREIALDGAVITLAGTGEKGHSDGSALDATLNLPSESVSDSAGNLYIADERNNLIRKLSTDGVLSTFAGAVELDKYDGSDVDGPAGVARIVSPFGITRGLGNDLFVSERSGVIRRIKPDGSVTTFVSPGAKTLVDGGPGVSRLHSPIGLIADGAGGIYVADSRNRAIRRISPQGVVTTVAAEDGHDIRDGHSYHSTFGLPSAVAIDALGNVYVGDGDQIKKISAYGEISTLVSPKPGEMRNGIATPSKSSPIRWVGGLAVAPDGTLYASDSQRNVIFKVKPDGKVLPFAGYERNDIFMDTSSYSNGLAGTAEFRSPSGIAVGADGAIYVADRGYHAIRKIKWGWVSTIAGGIHDFGKRPEGGYVDGAASEAMFSSPVAVAIDKKGNLYVADQGNRAIRRIDANGFVSTLFGPERQFDTILGPLPASVGIPEGVAVLADGRLAISVLNGILIATGARY